MLDLNPKPEAEHDTHRLGSSTVSLPMHLAGITQSTNPARITGSLPVSVLRQVILTSLCRHTSLGLCQTGASL
jgi:hypothetical protein